MKSNTTNYEKINSNHIIHTYNKLIFKTKPLISDILRSIEMQTYFAACNDFLGTKILIVKLFHYLSHNKKDTCHPDYRQFSNFRHVKILLSRVTILQVLRHGGNVICHLNRRPCHFLITYPVSYLFSKAPRHCCP